MAKKIGGSRVRLFLAKTLSHMACQDGQFDVVELMIQNELCVKSSPFLIVFLYTFLYQEIKSSLYDIVNGTSMHKK